MRIRLAISCRLDTIVEISTRIDRMCRIYDTATCDDEQYRVAVLLPVCRRASPFFSKRAVLTLRRYKFKGAVGAFVITIYRDRKLN